ncbi:hypothetical protein A2592_00245 [Candidatus Kaiserbacteria bacterium RIFOXYD1_FULL_42_15]|uniref:Glycosyl transferase family 1 domain-containing protein n=1 Tax=Candidatus Kaiserbacteria bacterium RIFOXYD1_FULL_42_15 TaxID=1798532 RepID=A0A1F6FTT5_9BACT|nr:MAG: hypothetical protein A2592_00245 [Candidatus Kaiserbacteria bacterium RIFOXYD1_FULL_42_15]
MLKDEVKQNTKKRVLIVIGTLAIGGGAEKVAATIGSELTRRGHEVHLLTFYEADQKYDYIGIYHTLGEALLRSRLSKVARIPLRILAIRRYAKQYNIDVAVSFLEEANFYTLLTKLFLYWRLSVIVSVRNNIEKREWPFKLATRILYPFAKKVVSVTKVIEEILKLKFNLRNTTTIYNPLDLVNINKMAGEPLPLELVDIFNHHPLLISIGRLIQQKGQWHLIRAFVAVRQAHPQARLVILGEGEYRKKLEQLIIDCGLSDSVFLIGKHENVYRFLAAADIFVFSSLWEGMPNTMLEALAVGLPIISPDCVSGPREIIAPEVEVDGHIGYPYVTESGVLTQPLENDIIWSTTEPLTAGELVLSQAIKDSLLTLGSHHAKNDDKLIPFSLATVTDQWEKLVLGSK